MKKYRVCVYEKSRIYGGDEEGGWWYDSFTLITVISHDTVKEAIETFENLVIQFFDKKDCVIGITQRYVKRYLQNGPDSKHEYSPVGLIAMQQYNRQYFC